MHFQVSRGILGWLRIHWQEEQKEISVPHTPCLYYSYAWIIEVEWTLERKLFEDELKAQINSKQYKVRDRKRSEIKIGILKFKFNASFHIL